MLTLSDFIAVVGLYMVRPFFQSKIRGEIDYIRQYAKIHFSKFKLTKKRGADRVYRQRKGTRNFTCELPMILRLKKLILCNLHKMSFFLILLQLSDRR